MKKNRQEEPVNEEQNVLEIPSDDIHETAEPDEPAVDALTPAAAVDAPAKKPIVLNPAVVKAALTVLATLAVILIIYGVGNFFINLNTSGKQVQAINTATPIPTHDSRYTTPVFLSDLGLLNSIQRAAWMNIITPTLMPGATQQDGKQGAVVDTYVVEKGDTLFGIADKFGLKPETVLWSNRYILGDTPDTLAVGMTINILPIDGDYYRWTEGDGLNGVARFYGINPDVIINYEGNNLDPATIGEYSNPNIEPGTMLIIPGGVRPVVSWVIPRDNPAVGASYLGPGACTSSIYGARGTGTYIFPTYNPWISGYYYTPPTHNGLDFGGDDGDAILAVDSGVVVYSGPTNGGYGNLIIIDHDGGYQTYYAHLLDAYMAPCGTSVTQGAVIASMGNTGASTGSHLHFEIRYNGLPVDPNAYLR